MNGKSAHAMAMLIIMESRGWLNGNVVKGGKCFKEKCCISTKVGGKVGRKLKEIEEIFFSDLEKNFTHFTKS